MDRGERGERARVERNGEVHGSGSGAGGGGAPEDYDGDPQGGGGDEPQGAARPISEGEPPKDKHQGIKA